MTHPLSHGIDRRLWMCGNLQWEDAGVDDSQVGSPVNDQFGIDDAYNFLQLDALSLVRKVSHTTPSFWSHCTCSDPMMERPERGLAVAMFAQVNSVRSSRSRNLPSLTHLSKAASEVTLAGGACWVTTLGPIGAVIINCLPNWAEATKMSASEGK